jgi:hypothetical protein
MERRPQPRLDSSPLGQLQLSLGLGDGTSRMRPEGSVWHWFKLALFQKHIVAPDVDVTSLDYADLSAVGIDSLPNTNPNRTPSITRSRTTSTPVVQIQADFYWSQSGSFDAPRNEASLSQGSWTCLIYRRVALGGKRHVGFLIWGKGALRSFGCSFARFPPKLPRNADL